MVNSTFRPTRPGLGKLAIRPEKMLHPRRDDDDIRSGFARTADERGIPRWNPDDGDYS
jgi:hypothetical protein